jgi:hypothetical protein
MDVPIENLSKAELIEKLKKTERYAADRAELEIKIFSAIRVSQQREKEITALMNGSKAVLEQKGFLDSARTIFDLCKDLIGATSGYVALLSIGGDENEVLFLEAGGLPCDVDPKLPMPIRGLRAEAYQKRETVYHNDFMKSEWVDYMPKGHVLLKNVMFAPLVLDGRAVGVMGLANKGSDFNDKDAKLATSFGEIAAIALQNSRNLDERNKVEKDREKLIKDLKNALANIKTLSGLLPICASCKKIRDDKGYWNQIETYIREHSEADFSHGICPECAEKIYPDLEEKKTLPPVHPDPQAD